MNTAVLFLIFNRADTTERVLESIRKARPERLYVACDGPRRRHASDEGDILRTRAVVEQGIDWPCRMQTRFLQENLGCARAVASAIDWFFEQEEEGIILEDDCLPDPSFFRFCSELLERFRADHSIGHIGGNTFFPGAKTMEASYYASHLNHIWGWATWRRAWKHYDHKMHQWPEFRNSVKMMQISGSRKSRRHWHYHFNLAFRDHIDTWDYRWTFACWRNELISLLPKINLVANIGFDARATHTTGANSGNPAATADSLDFPLQHPPKIKIDGVADHFVQEHYFSRLPGPRRRFKQFLKTLFPSH